jgi:CheY-like chemotaxis protein
MPEVDGIRATHDITAADDLRDVKIIMLTTFETDELIIEVCRSAELWPAGLRTEIGGARFSPGNRR